MDDAYAGPSNAESSAKLLLSAMSSSIVKLLVAEGGAHSVICSRSKKLLDRLLSQAQDKAGLTLQEMSVSFGQPLAGALLPSVTEGLSSSEASDLLAALIDAFGTDIAAEVVASPSNRPRYARGVHPST